MGRFYKSESPTPLDYMYQIDAPLMEKALMTNDKYIDQSLTANEQTGQLAAFNSIEKDQEAAQKIRNDYNQKVEAITNAIKADPSAYRKQLNPIADLRKKLVEDYTTGAISKYVGNYNQRKEDFDLLQKQEDLYNKTGGHDKDGNEVGVSPERAAAYRAHWDEAFKGTNYDPNNPQSYSRYAPARVMNNINIQKRLSAGIKEMKDDGSLITKTTLTGGEEYFDKETNSWEGLTPAKILGLVRDRYYGDQQLQQYIAEDTKVGLLNNIFYPKDVIDPKTGSVVHRAGETISPYSIGLTGISPEQQHEIDLAQIDIDNTKNKATKEKLKALLADHVAQLKNATEVKWEAESGLAPIFRGIVDQFSHSKTTDSSELKGGTNWGARFNQASAWARQTRQLDQQATRDANINARLWSFHNDEMADKNTDNTLAREKFEWDKDHPKGSGTGLKKTSSTVGTAPQTTGVADLATNSFNAILTQDVNGEKVPMLSSAGLIGDIVSKKAQLADIDKRLAADPSRSDLVLRKKELQSDLSLRRDWYAKSTNAVLSNSGLAGTPLDKEEIALYHEFSNDVSGEKFQQHIANVEKQYPKVLYDESLRTGLKKKQEELATALKEYGTASDVPRSAGGEILSGYIDRKGQLGKQIGELRRDIAAFDKGTAKIDSPEVAAEKEKLTKYYAAARKTMKNRDQFLREMRKNRIDADAIIPTQVESDQIMETISSDVSGLQLFSSEGLSTASSTLKSGKKFWSSVDPLDMFHDKYGGDFSSGFNDYLKVNNVKTLIRRIAPSTKLGNGDGVMEVQFDDPSHKISDKPFYIALIPELTRRIATKFKTNADPRVVKIANDMLDDEATHIRNQIAQPKINTLIGSADTEQSFDIIVTARNGDMAPLNITRFPDSDRIIVTMKHPQTGKDVPFPFGNNVPHGTKPGEFGSPTDFILNFKDIKYNLLKPNGL